MSAHKFLPPFAPTETPDACWRCGGSRAAHINSRADMPDERLRELAHHEARRRHNENRDQELGSDGRILQPHEEHHGPFEQCQQADCRLVRGESSSSLNAEAGAVDAASSVDAQNLSSLSSSLVRSSSSLRTLVENKQWRQRSEKQLRDTLSMLCNFIWTRSTRPGEHMWTIPVDVERDFDCILSDAIDELIALRAALLSPVEQEIAELREAKNLPPLQSSCCHSFGEWCDNCVGAVVREFNELRKRLSPVEGRQGEETRSPVFDADGKIIGYMMG